MGVISISSRMAAGVHRQAKCFELNFLKIMRKTFLLVVRLGRQNHTHNRSVCPVLCPYQFETPDPDLSNMLPITRIYKEASAIATQNTRLLLVLIIVHQLIPHICVILTLSVEQHIYLVSVD